MVMLTSIKLFITKRKPLHVRQVSERLRYDRGMQPDELPCHEKLAFDTQKQAQAAATVALYQHGATLKTYICRHCQLWHLSSNLPD